MTHHEHHVHDGHTHAHGPGCGHPQVAHDDHADYLHSGHLHHVHDDHVDEHAISDSAGNLAGCTPGHACDAHAESHRHGPSCVHDTVPHADHTDYLVDDHLHHPHDGHCDDHGALRAA